MIRFLFLFLCSSLYSQSLYKFDYIESYDWSGGWFNTIPTSGYYTNAFVSSTSSAALYGSGNGSSAVEQNWYVFPNLDVDPSYDYKFSFRLASYRFTSTNATRGVDASDYVVVQLSTDGGNTYVNELRINGNSNAFWDYNTLGTYTKAANGVQTIISPAGGGNRTSTGDGYSVISLDIPSGTTQIAIDIFARVNSAGEEWWFDNFELTRIGGPLPVELLYFDAYSQSSSNILKWATASEQNSSHFVIERSNDGVIWDYVNTVLSSVNSTEKINYTFVDNDYENTLNYYRLVQFDMDGKFTIYGLRLIDNSESRRVVSRYNLLGQPIDESFSGFFIEFYDDKTFKKSIK